MKLYITRRILVGSLGLLLLGVLSVGALSFVSQGSPKDAPTKPPDTTEQAASNNPKTSDSLAESTGEKYQQASSSEPSSATSRQVATPDVSPSSQTFKTESGETFPLRTYKTLSANDPNATQWWTTSTGLDAAWSIGAGAYQTTVAVIDTGFGLQHEEFANRWATNSAEQGATANQSSSVYNCTDRQVSLNQSCNLIDDNFDGILDNETGATTAQNPSRLNCTDRAITLDKSCNLIDDDNNGYIDDVTGWDFANFDNNVQAGETNPDGDGTTHGTKVVGVLAATGNNNKGIAGVNWTTKILPLQAINDESYGNTLTVARAIYYAADRGVDIISLSLGASSEDPYLRQAIHYALDNDIFVVAASGNDGCNCISYPAQYPEVFAVGAQQPNGNASSFSSYGDTLDIMAPGEDIITTTWTKNNPTNSYVGGIDGTSFAAPYISGLLSLARSHQPSASWGEISNTLLAVANHANLTFSNPTSPQIGSGFAKADSMMRRMTIPASPFMRYTFGATPIIGTLSSGRTYQCYQPDDFPTAPLYRIASGSSVFYTIDTLEYVRAVNRGDVTRSLGRTCVGLVGDSPSVTRVINLLREIDTINNKTTFGQ
jgi:hypothetical protein